MIRLMALALACALCSGLLGFGAARLVLAPPVLALFQPELAEVLLTGSTDQVRRRFHLGLRPGDAVPVGDPVPEGVSGDTATALELLATRGDADLFEIAVSSAGEVDLQVVAAAICVGARLGHRSQTLRAAPLFPALRDADTGRCRPEGLRPSEVARQSGHGGVFKLLRDQGL